ncbi:MAG: dUTP diphosphatase [Patescibacteria group bacterium]
MTRRERRPKKDRRRNLRPELQVLIADDAKDLPIIATKKEGDVGFDLYVARETIVPPGATLPPTDLYCGVRVKLPKGTWGLLMFRSGTHGKYPSLRLCQAPIDEGYTGPLDPRVRNVGRKAVRIPRGERLVQLVIVPAVIPRAAVVDELPETERGTTGFGSTGR